MQDVTAQEWALAVDRDVEFVDFNAFEELGAPSAVLTVPSHLMMAQRLVPPGTLAATHPAELPARIHAVIAWRAPETLARWRSELELFQVLIEVSELPHPTLNLGSTSLARPQSVQPHGHGMVTDHSG